MTRNFFLTALDEAKFMIAAEIDKIMRKFFYMRSTSWRCFFFAPQLSIPFRGKIRQFESSVYALNNEPHYYCFIET